jgi:hypothetical protein
MKNDVRRGREAAAFRDLCAIGIRARIPVLRQVLPNARRGLG